MTPCSITIDHPTFVVQYIERLSPSARARFLEKPDLAISQERTASTVQAALPSKPATWNALPACYD